jgi:hypothetical protein
VLYDFNVPAVRARIVLSRVPALVKDAGDHITIREVPDLSRYDIPSLNVTFDEPYPHQLDAREISLLGGSVAHVQFSSADGGRVRGFRAALPDRSVPEVRGWSNVDEVFTSAGGACLA